MSFFDFDESGSYDGNLWGIGVDYELSNRIDLGLTYNRDYVVSVSRGISKSDVARAFVNYHKRLNANLEFFTTKSKYSEENLEFKDYRSEDKSVGGRLNISYPLYKRFTLNFDSNYAYWEFEPDNEKVDRYGLGCSINYNFIRNFDISLSYTYHIDDSDIDENDYRNNIALLSIGWRLGR